MKKITLSGTISGSYSSSDGYSLFCILRPHFDDNTKVEVSLLNFPVMSSSFFNSSFGELIEQYGMAKFREIIKFSNVTTSQAQLLRKYIEFHLQ